MITILYVNIQIDILLLVSVLSIIIISFYITCSSNLSMYLSNIFYFHLWSFYIDNLFARDICTKRELVTSCIVKFPLLPLIYPRSVGASQTLKRFQIKRSCGSRVCDVDALTSAGSNIDIIREHILSIKKSSWRICENMRICNGGGSQRSALDAATHAQSLWGNFSGARKPPDRIKIDAGRSYLERLEFLQAGWR